MGTTSARTIQSLGEDRLIKCDVGQVDVAVVVEIGAGATAFNQRVHAFAAVLEPAPFEKAKPQFAEARSRRALIPGRAFIAVVARVVVVDEDTAGGGIARVCRAVICVIAHDRIADAIAIVASVIDRAWVAVVAGAARNGKAVAQAARSHTRVDRAGVVVGAVELRMHASGGWVAGIDGAEIEVVAAYTRVSAGATGARIHRTGVSIVAVPWRPDAQAVRTAVIRGTTTSVVTDGSIVEVCVEACAGAAIIPRTGISVIAIRVIKTISARDHRRGCP